MNTHEQTILELRVALEREAREAQVRAERDVAQLNEISRVNNELVNAQRALAAVAEAVRLGADSLKVSEQRYRRLFEAAKEGILVLDAETGEIEDVNPFLCHLLNYARDDLTGKQLWEIGTFRDIAANQDAFLTLQEQEYIRYEDLPLETKDGQSVSVEFISNVYVSAGKRVIQCNIRDITQRKQLERSRHLLASIVESSEDSIVSIDLNRIITSWNKSAEQLYGFPAAEVIGKSLTLLTLPEDFQEVLNNIDRIKHSETVEVFDTIRMNKDGHEMNPEIVLSPVKDMAGQVIGVSTIARDITERKQAEAELQKLSRAVEQSTISIVITDSAGLIEYGNPKFYELTGYTAQEALGQNSSILQSGQTPPETYESLWETIRAGREWQGEFVNKKKNGELFWEWAFISPVVNQAGIITHFVGVKEDITERKKADEALKASESRYHSLFENMLEGYAYCRTLFEGDQLRDFVYLEINSAFEKLTGLKDVVGNKVSDVVPGIHETNRELFEMFGRVALTGKPEKCETYLEPLDIWLSITAYSSEREHFVAVFDNITERKQAEQVIGWTVERLTDAQRIAQTGDWEWDIATQAITWSPQVFEIVGRDPRLGPPQNYEENTALYEPASAALMTEKVALAIESGEPQEYDLVVCRPNGEQVKVLARAVPRKDENGRVVSLYGTIQDITRRKQAEEALRASEARFSGAFEYAPIGVALVSLDGRWLQVNQAVCDVLGYPEAELLTRTFQEITHPDDLDEDLENMHRLLASETSSYQMEKRYFHARGHLVTVLLNVSLVRDSEGQPLYFISHIQDITERKQTEDALRKSEAEFRTLVEALPQIVWVTRPDGWHIHFNQRWMDYTGLTLEESLGFGWNPPFHPDDRMRASNIWQRATESGEPYEIEYRLRRADGAYRWMLGRALPMRDATGTIVKWFGTCTDIHDLKLAEDKLRTSEERYRALSEASPDDVFIVNRDSVLQYVNLHAAQEFGLPPESLVGKSQIELFPPLVAEANMRGNNRVFQSGEPLYEETRMEFSGRDSWQSTWLVPLKNVAGEIYEVMGVGRDITAIKQAEAALQKANDELESRVAERTAELERSNAALLVKETEQQQVMATLSQSEERFRLLVENVHDYAIMMLDTTGHIMTWNAGAERMKGYKAEEIIGQHFSRFYTEEDQQAGEPQQELRTAETEGYVDDEGWRVRQDGSRFWATLVITALRDDDGRLRGFAKITRDITERKQIEAELQRSREELQSFIDAMSTLAAKVAPDGRFLIFNKIAFDASGLPYEEYQNTNFLTGPWWTFDSEVQTRVGEKFREALTGTPINYDENIFVFGQVRTINFSLIPINDAEGKVEYVIAEGRDITELKETEAELQRAKGEADAANAAKSEFLSRMSHELRTPLNAIIGFGQILEMDDMPPKKRENVEHILKGGRHLLDLINEILDISRIEVGHLSLSLEPVPVDLTVREVLDLGRPLTAAGNIQLINEIPAHSDWYMLADRQRLNQILINLLSNAIKYNRDGGSVTVLGEEVSGEEVSGQEVSGQAGEQCGVLRLSIRDTGNGLSGDDIGKLFVPFERLGAAITRIEGTGIGLVLSKRLVEAMGGQIGVSSTPGQGSTFWIELPLVPNPLQSVQQQPETSALQTVITPEGEPKTVLYIEDNLANLQLIETLLEAYPDVRLLTAMQGSTGLDLAFAQSPDLILLDLHLPDINGDEVLRRLQANAATNSTPVVMISADAMPRRIERLLAAGAKTYLTKPINVKEFLSVLDENLRRKS